MKSKENTIHNIDRSYLLKATPIFTQGNFTLVLSTVYTLGLFLFWLGASNPILKNVLMILVSINLLFTLFQWFTVRKIKQSLLESGDIYTNLRKYSYILLLSLLVGNIFIVFFACNFVKEDISVEYVFSYYMIVTQLIVISLSALNVFKEYVVDTFPMAMITLFGLTIVQLVILFIIGRHVKKDVLSKKILYLFIPLLIITLTGNLFALLIMIGLFIKVQPNYNYRTSRWDEIWRIITNSSSAMLGLLFIVLMFTISIVSLFTFDYAMAVENNYGAILQNPSLTYPLGTDNFVRDVYSRIIFGTQISLIVGFMSSLIPAFIVGILGAFAGYFSEKTDNMIMRLLDVLYSIPGFLLAIAIIAAFGANTVNLIIALRVGSIPTYARTMRANVLMVSNYEFVDAARSLGSSDMEIIFRYIVPNSLSPMIVKATLTIGTAVIATSSLSFLGLGVEPHIPEWGNILKVGSTYLETHSYVALFPGAAIVLLVLSFNFFGDALRDALDPRTAD